MPFQAIEYSKESALNCMVEIVYPVLENRALREFYGDSDVL